LRFVKGLILLDNAIGQIVVIAGAAVLVT
jgi:hypothetical protein